MCNQTLTSEILCETCGKIVLKKIITSVIGSEISLKNFYDVLNGIDSDEQDTSSEDSDYSDSDIN